MPFLRTLPVPPRAILELGVFFGATTDMLLQHTPASTRLYCVDLWDSKYLLRDLDCQYGQPWHTVGDEGARCRSVLQGTNMLDVFLDNMRARGHSDRVFAMQMDSQEGVRALAPQAADVDLVVVDADNSFEGTRDNVLAAARAWPCAQVFGMVANKLSVRRGVLAAGKVLRRTAYVASTIDSSCYTWSFTRTAELCVPMADVALHPQHGLRIAMRSDNVQAFLRARDAADAAAAAASTASAAAKGKSTPWSIVAAKTNAPNILAHVCRESPEALEARTARTRVTPLIQAAFSHSNKALEWLLAHGADAHARNKWGETALAAAGAADNEAGAALLRAHLDAVSRRHMEAET